MVLTVGCLLRGTCYRHYHVLVSTTVMVFTSVEAAEVVATTAEALALRVLALAGEGPLLLPATLLGLPFLVQYVAA
jgi:hypothetical protein